jgi:hypothetical protein
MPKSLAETVHGVLERAPAWLRQDFGAKDPQVRERAEDVMAAMIAEAIAQANASNTEA